MPPLIPPLRHILIVDDEQPARDRLRRLLGQCEDEDSGGLIIDEARDGVEALERIEARAPQLIFLDIQMPEVSGLEVAASLPALPEATPLVVFVTAFDRYAIDAFDANAIDYLLKPYDLARLQRALERARARLHGAAPRPAAPIAPIPPKQLLVAERGVTRVLSVAQIGWIETADNYVVLHCGARESLLRQTLAALLEQLGPRFVRCHRRAAVQLAMIDSVAVNDKGDGHLLLRDGAQVPCSRQYRAEVMARLHAAAGQS